MCDLSGDGDGDGWTNSYECSAGSDPCDASSTPPCDIIVSEEQDIAKLFITHDPALRYKNDCKNCPDTCTAIWSYLEVTHFYWYGKGKWKKYVPKTEDAQCPEDEWIWTDGPHTIEKRYLTSGEFQECVAAIG